MIHLRRSTVAARRVVIRRAHWIGLHVTDSSTEHPSSIRLAKVPAIAPAARTTPVIDAHRRVARGAISASTFVVKGDRRADQWRSRCLQLAVPATINDLPSGMKSSAQRVTAGARFLVVARHRYAASPAPVFQIANPRPSRFVARAEHQRFAVGDKTGRMRCLSLVPASRRRSRCRDDRSATSGTGRYR